MQKGPKFNLVQFNGHLAELTGDNWEARQQALCGLAKYSSAEWASAPEAVAAASGPLIEMAGGAAPSNPALRAHAIQVLGNFGGHSSAALTELLHLLRRDSDTGVQTAAAGLGKMGAAAESAGEALTAALSDPKRDPALRSAAAEALARVAPLDPDVVAALRAAAGDKNGSLSVCAAAALWVATKDARAIQALAERLSDPTARDAAVQALYRIGPPARAAVPALQSFAAGKDRLFREAVVMAIGKITAVAVARSW